MGCSKPRVFEKAGSVRRPCRCRDARGASSIEPRKERFIDSDVGLGRGRTSGYPRSARAGGPAEIRHRRHARRRARRRCGHAAPSPRTRRRSSP
jgi:hypothetical protein